MSEKQLRCYWQMFVDIWRLFRKFKTPDGSQKYWSGFILESNRMDERYGHSEIYRDLAVAVTKELQRLEKRMYGKSRIAPTGQETK